jgi:hypothetical protein
LTGKKTFAVANATFETIREIADVRSRIQLKADVCRKQSSQDKITKMAWCRFPWFHGVAKGCFLQAFAVDLVTLGQGTRPLKTHDEISFFHPNKSSFINRQKWVLCYQSSGASFS